ncbi:HAMP domain-containing sensor histidine kinase [Oceaniovalibus sp. ACAM 378]|uniref:HAMP domain-containing sensor histidine kinase n=1 Tax=Oceaniovalibus sp. ACAM 378 TaxID=2599923 RepID=UPI0011D6AA6B|nr:HAMP domain-containing sensor histidine kinase [Oceaniovalibus sp. ACAM 378]TYB89066.1 HAMP domain-containing histidine kinase [Oceaniovalibus sp. ACAM 378]
MSAPFRSSGIRSTPLRLTLILLMIFAVAALGCLAVAYEVTRGNIDATLEADLEQTVSDYRAIRDADDLENRLSEAAANTDPEVRILQYLPDRGARISNVADFPPIREFAVVPEDAIKAGDDDDDLAESYLALSVRVGRGQLIVAHSREQIVEMGEVFLSVLLMGLLPALIIAGCAGAWIARTARRRIDTIEGTLRDLTGGTLSARVDGIEGRADDLSGIGHRVNQMADAQEALISSMRQISADIAHDLKTPIQRVAVVLDQMRNRTVLSDGQEGLLNRALDETDRIVRTFQALLQLAQIEGGAVRDRFRPTDLADVARDVVDFLGLDAEERGFVLTIDAPEDGTAIVKGDRQLLSQLITNLIQNALTHALGGGPIKVIVAQGLGGVTLTLSDQGPGIPLAEREKVLRRLYRLEQSRTTEGNGLGLSLVSAISHLHGALLTLEDNAPGLRVRIAFPAPLSM